MHRSVKKKQKGLKKLRLCIFVVAVFKLGLQPYGAYAALSLPFSDVLSNNLGILSNKIVNPFIKTLGIILNHRSYEPATPLGTTAGVDLGVEVTLVQMPTSLTSELATEGYNVTFPPFLPSAKYLNFHKGISDRTDVGLSVVSFQNNLVWGADVKMVVFQPEEGPTWALRLSYNSISLPVGTISETVVVNQITATASASLKINAVTWTPQILISKKFEFADPYIGIGYQLISGSINLTTTSNLPIPNLNESISGKGGSFISFLGLSLRVPGLGVRVTMEGSYCPEGYNALGAKIGIGF